MTQFLGTHINRIDAKGRVSIPAAFRAALKDAEGAPALILRPSHKHDCIEGWPRPVFEAMATPAESIDPFDEDQEDRLVSLYGDATEPTIDKEGRMALPPELAQYAGITDAVAFIGAGRWFQIWEPAAAEKRRAEARERTRAKGLSVRGA